MSDKIDKIRWAISLCRASLVEQQYDELLAYVTKLELLVGKHCTWHDIQHVKNARPEWLRDEEDTSHE